MRKSMLLLTFMGLMLVLALVSRPLGKTASANPQELLPRAYLPFISLPPIVPGFQATPTNGQIPLVVDFSNTSTGPFMLSRWDFGDGFTSTLTHPSHTYTRGGVYTVTLTLGRLEPTVPLTKSAYITATSPLQNGSFEDGWTDMPPAGELINQQPNHWTLDWLEPGERLYDDVHPENVAGVIPECIHKLKHQLPADEWPGGPQELIKDGESTYKIFASSGFYGAQLSQTIKGLQPGMTGILTVPIQLVYYTTPGTWDAESGMWVNGVGAWANVNDMGYRSWYYHQVTFTVPPNGEIDILIRVKNKWQGKDFFIDGIQLALIP